MDDKKSIINFLLQSTALTFGSTILAISFVGWLLGRVFSEPFYELGGIFLFGSEGLAYQSIAQIFALSVIIGVLLTIFVSDIFFKKVMILWRCLIFILLSLVTLCLFVIIFQWFPIDVWEAWVMMAVLFVAFFALGAAPVIIKIRLEERRYKKLLSDYKSRKSSDKGEDL